MLCCGADDRPKRAIDILKANPQPCARHKKPTKFICRTCLQQSLLCQQCILDHQEHDWLSLANFLNDDVMNLFETGKSKSGHMVEQSVDKIANSLFQFQKKLDQRIKKLIASLLIDLEKLKAKFPTEVGYQISGRNLNKKNVKQIISILSNQSNQKFLFDIQRMQKMYNQILQVTDINIKDLFDKVQETLCGHEWDLLHQRQIQKIQQNFYAIYKKVTPPRKFLFSVTEKNKSINITNGKLTAVYMNELPKCPVVLLDKFFRQEQHTVAFKVTKLQTHAYFFNMSVVYLGVCNATFAEGFGYSDLAKPSKGAYMISSAGRCYHSKLPQYDDKGISFGFGPGDIIMIDVNIANKSITFEKKTGKVPFGKKISMPLSLDLKFIYELKPFVMFSNEAGAQVTILNQTQLVLQLDGKVLYKVKND